MLHNNAAAAPWQIIGSQLRYCQSLRKIMPHIRATVLGCFLRNGSELLVMHGYDAVKPEFFYRFLGGGIELGETGDAALHREIREELQQEIRIIRRVGFFENIFVYAGKPHHEIMQIFLAEFIDPAVYQQENFEVTENYEGQTNPIASWMAISEFRNGGKILYPVGVLEALDGALANNKHTSRLGAPVLLKERVAEQLLEVCAEKGARKFLVDHLIENAELLSGGCFEFKPEDVNRYVLSSEISLAVGNDLYPETCHYHAIKTEIYIGGFHSFAIWQDGNLESAIVRKDFEGVVVIPPGWRHLMKPKAQLLWTMQIPNPVGSDKYEVELPPDIAKELLRFQLWND
jgi:ADP-ribose pyrophosphatase YjhB (NUDIX family)